MTHDELPDRHDPLAVYQHAMRCWQSFHAAAVTPEAADLLRRSRSISTAALADILRPLPACERRPVAFGMFLRAAAMWEASARAGFLVEFLDAPTPAERGLLEAAAMGALPVPRHLPLTLDEFPSRIWQRAVASGRPARLVTAAHLAVQAMIQLYRQHEDDTDLVDLMPLQLPSGDLPPFTDLLALPPPSCHKLKARVIERIIHEIRADRYGMCLFDTRSHSAWTKSGSEASGDHIAAVADDAARCMKLSLTRGKGIEVFHTRRLGKLLFRLGCRRMARQCARVVGGRPSRFRWHHQPIPSAGHARIRKAIIRHGSPADAWLTDPALACSAMSTPLWLGAATPRTDALAALFRRARECPWVFPRLQHIYQWHLALAGRFDLLREIEQLAPELAVGLSGRFAQDTSNAGDGFMS